MKFIPRFQGNALEDDKGWFWELFVSQFGGGSEADKFITKHRFKTKDEALQDLHTTIQTSIDNLAKNHPELGIEAGALIDLKSNEKLIKNKIVN